VFLKIVSAAAAVVLLSGAAPALSPWATAQLKDMDAFGFGGPVENLTWEGTIPSGTAGSVDLQVPAAGTYFVVGSCGEDCEDIGLILQQGDATVAEGITGFKAELQPGLYKLNIGFDRCGEPQCRYVVRAYRPG
jgi:hypothetical protein